MKKKFQKTMKMVFALCMAVLMVFSTVSSAQAAGYVKSFTKSITLKGGEQCAIQMETKSASGVTVTISTTSKDKNKNIHATVPGAEEYQNYAAIIEKQKKGSVKVTLSEGNTYIYLTNYGMSKAKVKIKVSANDKILKFVSKEISDNIG